MRKITAAGLAALAALALAGCASPIGEAFEEAPATTADAPAPVTVPSATPTATAADTRFVLEIDGQRDFSAPALGTAVIDLSDGTLAFADGGGLPIGAPMLVTVDTDADLITPVSADVTAIISDADGTITGFNAISWALDELDFVNIRATDTAPVRSPEDLKGSVALIGHVAPAAWDTEATAVWSFGSVSRGDLALNITE